MILGTSISQSVPDTRSVAEMIPQHAFGVLDLACSLYRVELVKPLRYSVQNILSSSFLTKT
jgi:hypothetical protein